VVDDAPTGAGTLPHRRSTRDSRSLVEHARQQEDTGAQRAQREVTGHPLVRFVSGIPRLESGPGKLTVVHHTRRANLLEVERRHRHEHLAARAEFCSVEQRLPIYQLRQHDCDIIDHAGHSAIRGLRAERDGWITQGPTWLLGAVIHWKQRHKHRTVRHLLHSPCPSHSGVDGCPLLRCLLASDAHPVSDDN
jgi:hypothetical protein